jgi:hypothetical protein
MLCIKMDEKIIGINIHVENIMQVENLEKYYIVYQNIFQ